MWYYEYATAMADVWEYSYSESHKYLLLPISDLFEIPVQGFYLKF